VVPNNISIGKDANQQFTARGLDQFGNLMTLGAISWSSTAGSVSGSGMFGSSTLGQSIRIIATSGGISGFAIVNVVQVSLDIAKAFPVPFKPALGHTVITFQDLAVDATIKIYTIHGELVAEIRSPLGNDVTWDVKNSDGESVASGVYIYQIKAGPSEKRGKLVIIR
jgi:hypothetical protein